MLRQGSKIVEEYYDEFKNMRMKSKLEENIRFMENLRYNILKPLKLKNYYTLEVVFHDASKLDVDLKEERFYKTKTSFTSTLNKNKIISRKHLLKGNIRVLANILKSRLITSPRQVRIH